MTYSAVVDGGITTEATLTKITVDGVDEENMQPNKENTLLITTNLMPNAYGVPRVYYTSTDPAGYQECTDVLTTRDESGYLTITCKVTPTQRASGVTLHIVPRGSSEDVFCTDNTYQPNTSDCEAGEWKWGSFEISGLAIGDPMKYMQDFTADMCDDLTTGGEQIQLTDNRDGKMYWVGRLPDGNCWMTQNLDLDLSTSRTLTPADTNISSNWTPNASTFTYLFSSTFYSEDEGESYDPGDVYYEDTSGTDSHYHVGNYYQRSAANANYPRYWEESTQSICPAGWTLPSGNQFQQLINSGLTRSNFMNAPYYFIRAGYLGNGSLRSAGEEGTYRSSTPGTYSDNASGLSVRSRGVSVGQQSPINGMSVRCIAAG